MHRRCRRLLVLGALALAVAPSLWMTVRGWDPERREMYRRFDLIEVGMTRSEAEEAIGMENNGMRYSGRRPELVAGRDTDHGTLVFSADGEMAYGFGGEVSAAYQYERYTILIHFEPGPDERVTGNGLFRSVERTGLAARLFGP